MPKYSTEVEAWIPPLTVSAAVVDQSLPKPLWWKEEGERDNRRRRRRRRRQLAPHHGRPPPS